MSSRPPPDGIMDPARQLSSETTRQLRDTRQGHLSQGGTLVGGWRRTAPPTYRIDSNCSLTVSTGSASCSTSTATVCSNQFVFLVTRLFFMKHEMSQRPHQQCLRQYVANRDLSIIHIRQSRLGTRPPKWQVRVAGSSSTHMTLYSLGTRSTVSAASSEEYEKS